MSEWIHHNKGQQTSLKKCLCLPNACSWTTVHFFRKENKAKQKKEILAKIIPPRCKSWALLVQWLSFCRTVFISARICLTQISYVLILLQVWLIEKMAIRSNLRATPHCSLPSGPHLGPLPEPSPYPTYLSSLSTVGPLVANVAPGSVTGLRVLSTSQHSLLMTTRRHCGFSSMTESLSCKTTFNESIMETYTVFLHPGYTIETISLFAVPPVLQDEQPFFSNRYSHCSRKC